jgi:uncharacterized protein YgiM (DUF1202 family)
VSKCIFPVWRCDFSRWKKFALPAAAMLSTIAMLLLESCQSAGEKAMPPAGRFVVKVEKTYFYHIGPAQASGPDLQLFKGQRLTVIKRDFGYSQVVLDDGQSGYVPTEDLTPAPPDSTPTPPPKSRREHSAQRTPSLPPNGSMTPLPLPEKSEPNFRF